MGSLGSAHRMPVRASPRSMIAAEVQSERNRRRELQFLRTRTAVLQSLRSPRPGTVFLPPAIRMLAWRASATVRMAYGEQAAHQLTLASRPLIAAASESSREVRQQDTSKAMLRSTVA